MSDDRGLGFFRFLQGLFGRGDKPRSTKPVPPAKKNSPSHAPRKPPGKGAAKKEPRSDEPAKEEPPSRDKPAKKLAAKPKSRTKPKAPPPAAPAEAPGEVPPHERPPADREKENREEKIAPSVYSHATPETPESKTASANPVPPPGGPTAPHTVLPDDLPPEDRKTGKPGS